MKRPPLPAPKPLLDGSTMALYADGGPAQKAQDFWERIRDRWTLPWTPTSGSDLVVAAGILSLRDLLDFCEALDVNLNQALAFLAIIVDKDNQIHAEVRSLFQEPRDAHGIIRGSNIDQRLAAIPLLRDGVRVWRFRQARANHNRTLRAKSAD